MTENEKLRALLAEARAVVAGTISAHGLMHRIDAALAEPVNVKWQAYLGFQKRWTASVNGFDLVVTGYQDTFGWSAECKVGAIVGLYASGNCRTLADAQRKAEETAGMRRPLAEPVRASRMEKPSNTTWARFAYDFRERAEAAERERDEARAEVERLRNALALSEVDVALERTWCRLCRTENRSSERSRDAHPHETRCPLARRKEIP